MPRRKKSKTSKIRKRVSRRRRRSMSTRRFRASESMNLRDYLASNNSNEGLSNLTLFENELNRSNPPIVVSSILDDMKKDRFVTVSGDEIRTLGSHIRAIEKAVYIITSNKGGTETA